MFAVFYFLSFKRISKEEIIKFKDAGGKFELRLRGFDEKVKTLRVGRFTDDALDAMNGVGRLLGLDH